MLHFFWRRMRRGERGFTLIELLIVVAIIAILAAILIPNFLRARAQSQVSASKGNVKNIGTALESYFVDKGSYPDTLTGLTTGVQYIRATPIDPCTNTAYDYTPSGTPPNDYVVLKDWPTGNQCDSIAGYIRYTPAGGLESGTGPGGP